MLISKNLLAHLQPQLRSVTNDQLATALIQIGVEVENCYTHSVINNLAYGYVHATKLHPRSQKLRICDVELNNGERKEIVCGAQNVRAGLKVVVANENAILPNKITIGQRTILGIVSNGMICSYAELSGLDPIPFNKARDDVEGIIELDVDFDFKQPFDLAILGLNDVIYDLTIPANRADLYGAFGLVIELSQKLFLSYNPPSELELISQIHSWQKTFDWQLIKAEHTGDFASFVSLKKSIHKSSKWVVKQLLLNNNVACVNELVDFGQLLSLLFNQPVHFHDQKVFSTKKIVIKQVENRDFVDLNHQTHQLTTQTIAITNAVDELLALGGIIGSAYSQLQPTTTDVIFELINFPAETILKSALSLKINTDASERNQKHKSSYLALITLVYAFKWFQAQQFEPQIQIVFLNSIKPIKIHYDIIRLQKFLGTIFETNKIQKQLQALGFHFEANFIIVPPWRADVHDLNDVAEEISNLLDLNQLPSVPVVSALVNPTPNLEFQTWKKIRHFLLSKNCYEAKTYNLQKRSDVCDFNFMNFQIGPALINAHSQARTTMRMHGLQQLLEILKFNKFQQNGLNTWFELIQIQQNQQSFTTLNLVAPQNVHSPGVNNSFLKHDFHDLLAIVQSIDLILFENFKIVPAKKLNEQLPNVFVLENTVAIYNQREELCGYLGQLNWTIVKHVKLNLKTACLGLFLMLQARLSQPVKTPIYSQFPSSFQNYSIVVCDSKFELNFLINQIKQLPNVASVEVLERYFVSEHECSYLLSVRLNSLIKTLTSKDIEAINIQIHQLFDQHHIKIR